MDPNVLKNFTDIIPEESRNSLLKPTMANIGIIIDGIFLSVFGPLVKYGLVKQYEIDSFAKGLDSKLQNIPYEKRTDENKLIALKAFEDSRYQLNNSELREMFTSLIASMFNSDNHNEISPVYSSILSQMSPQSATLFKKWIVEHKLNFAPMGTIEENLVTGGSISTESGLLILNHDQFIDSDNVSKTQTTVHSYSTELSELSYLGLVTLQKDIHLMSDSDQLFYQAIADYKGVPMEDTNLYKIGTPYLKRGLASLTELGINLGSLLFN